jgi:hypothetical protein
MGRVSYELFYGSDGVCQSVLALQGFLALQVAQLFWVVHLWLRGW